jgi:ribosomal protein S12 methylthiotransferase accessory factor
MISSVLSDTTRFSAWPSDSGGAGYAFDDERAATGAAIGEAVERYCGNLVPAGLPRAAYVGLAAAGIDAVDPESVALFAPEQYAATGFPFAPLSRDLAMTWADGVDLVSGSSVLVPASLVWVSLPAVGVPPTNPIIQAGLATGLSRQAAEWSALCELVERDTMAMTWTGRGKLTRVEPPAHIARLASGPTGALTTRFYAFPNEFGLTLIGALVRDASTGYLTLGMGCHNRPLKAMVKALGEALQLQLFVGDYDDPDGPYMRAAANDGSPLKCWRAARDYSAAYRADFRDVIDYGCHLQMYLDPVIQDSFEAELAESTAGHVALADLPGEPTMASPDPADNADLAALVGRIADAGLRVVSVDVTTDDVRRCGLHVVRVLVPGLYSNSAAGMPFLGGTRLPERLAGNSPRLLPLPH